MANHTNGSTPEELAQDISQSLNEFGRQARKRADEAKTEAVKGLNALAETLRREAREAGEDPNVVEKIDEVARGLEKASLYLKTNTYEDMREDVETQVRRNPMTTLGLVFVAGLIFGLILRGGRRR
jgi:ElaB/YqjD/DUF883 family membrane-anchored ribosome-binding protein